MKRLVTNISEYPRLSASIIVVCIALIFTSTGYAAEKNWSAGGDGSTWSDEDNWSPAVEPTTLDDILIDVEDASVVCAETFRARSVIIGGRTSSTLISSNFIFGTISPDSGSDIAVHNRRDGKFTLEGAGVVTVQGQYKDSEASLTSEPSFLFWIE